MRAIARAHQNRNLADFEKALRDYGEGSPRLFLLLYLSSPSFHPLFRTQFSLSLHHKSIWLIPPSTELSSDPTIRSHLAALYDTLLEQNFLRIIEPYSTVEIEHVAEIVGQGRQAVETKYVSHSSFSTWANLIFPFSHTDTTIPGCLK
jgi:26S proteasome regulatory subunit N6